jgi:hypothetical protein
VYLPGWRATRSYARTWSAQQNYRSRDVTESRADVVERVQCPVREQAARLRYRWADGW